MADVKASSLLQILRGRGVKRIRFSNASGVAWVTETIEYSATEPTLMVNFGIEEVEFFPEPALPFDATDDEPDTSGGEPVVAVPPALARIIRKGSVS